MVSLTRFMNSLGDKNVFPLLGTGRVPFMGDLSPFKEEEQRGSRGLRVIFLLLLLSHLLQFKIFNMPSCHILWQPVLNISIRTIFLMYITILWLYSYVFHKYTWKHLGVKGQHTCTYSQFKTEGGGRITTQGSQIKVKYLYCFFNIFATQIIYNRKLKENTSF